MSARLLMTRLIVVAGLLASMAPSLPLWHSHAPYPPVPVFDFIPAFPAPLDSLAFLAFAIALGFLAWQPRPQVAAFVFFTAVFLVLQDQSRLDHRG